MTMDVKFGKIKSTSIISSSIGKPPDENFFTAQQNPKKQEKEDKKETYTPGSRMNDFDSNILENNAYQAIADDMFKLEHKINLLEESLNKITSEIETLESLGYDVQVSNLKERRLKLEQELIETNKQYSSLGLSTKFSGQIAGAVNFSSKKFGVLSSMKKFLSRKILAKISKKFNYRQTIGDALSNLSNINSNVDDLIKMQIPYGENISRYEKLTAYLNKANMIHSQINKNITKTTKKNT